MTREPTCREVVELVTEYVEGTLPGPEREALERHLEGCAGCTAYVQQMRAVITLAGSSPQDAVPLELKEALHDAFRDYQGHSPA